MSHQTWQAVDDYITNLFVEPDPALDAALAASDDAGLPQINVSPAQGKLLMLLARMQGAKRILEVGTLGGYSTIWLARALPEDGQLVTLELEPHHASVARENIAWAGFSDKVDIRVGAAVESLAQLAEEDQPPFDFIFIDADKPSNSDYFQWALKLARRGSVIIVDNVVRNGEVIDASSEDENVKGVRDFNELAAAEPRVTMTAIQTVGTKGYDGFALMIVN